MSLFALCDRCREKSIAVDGAYLREHLGNDFPEEAQKFGDHQPWLRVSLPIPKGHPSNIEFTQKRVHLCNECAADLFKWWVAPKELTVEAKP